MSVSLTTFVDFVSKAGTPKLTVVKNDKHKGPYVPAQDFYKPLREIIIAMHQRGQSTSVLDALLSSTQDAKKRTAYPAIVRAYKRWLGRKTVAWFKPVSRIWSHGGLDVAVNPELGLVINGTPHLIKLYFKSEPLTKNRTDIVTHLMGITCANGAPAGCRMSVLDVRQANLIVPTVPIPGLTIQLQGEAAYWMTVWPQV